MTTRIWKRTGKNRVNENARLFDRMKVRQFLMPAFVVAGLSCAALSAHAQSPRSRMQCSPVTPDTKVPFIDVSQLPDISRDPLYFEGCSDRDYAWTLQSYPDPKYAPKRTYEHQARVNFLLQGLKDYVTTESDDWASYINAWLGSNLPPSDVERRRFSDGDTTRSMSYRTGNTLTKFGVTSEILSTYSTQHVSPQGVMIFSQRELVIRGLDTTKLCITSVDLQKAFENQPGYLFRPITVRTSQPRPNPEELAKLGGQWFGYDVYAFIEPVAKQAPGLMSFGFGFKPCAMNISFNLTKNIFQGDKQ